MSELHDYERGCKRNIPRGCVIGNTASESEIFGKVTISIGKLGDR